MKAIIFPPNNENGFSGFSQIVLPWQETGISGDQCAIYFLMVFMSLVTTPMNAATPALSQRYTQIELSTHVGLQTGLQRRAGIAVGAIHNDLSLDFLHREHPFDFARKTSISSQTDAKPDVAEKQRVDTELRQVFSRSSPTASIKKPAVRQTAVRKRLRFAFPIQISGNYSGYANIFETGESKHRSTTYVNRLDINWNSYIWRPWFASLGGILGLVATDGVSDGQGSGTIKSKGQQLLGEIIMQVFPQSRFPFEARVNKSETDNAIGNTHVQTHYLIGQKYRALNGQSDFDARYERFESNNLQTDTDVKNAVRLSYRGNSRKQLVSMSIVHEEDDSNTMESNASGKFTAFSAQHSLRNRSELTLESRFTHVNVSNQIATNDNDNQTSQLTVFTNWRPATAKSTMITGSIRLTDNLQESRSTRISTKRENSTIALNVSGNYELSPRVSLQGSLTSNRIAVDGDNSMSHSQSLRASFDPDGYQLGNYSYTWGTGAGIRNQSSRAQTEQAVSWSANHKIQRQWLLSNSTVHFAADQSISGTESNQPQNLGRLSHTMSLNWNASGGNQNSTLRMALSDIRSLTGEPPNFQLVNLQYNRQVSISRDIQWSGDMTLQASRYEQSDAEGGTSSEIYASGALQYQHRNLMGVPRLQLTADFEVNGKGLTPSKFDLKFDTQGADEQGRFKLDLRYQLGLINLNLLAKLVRTQGQLNKSIQLRLNRPLGIY